jgi:hypothetical protein
MYAGEDGVSEMLGSVEGPVPARSQAERVAIQRLNPSWLADAGRTMNLVLVTDREHAAYVRACLAVGRMPD